MELQVARKHVDDMIAKEHITPSDSVATSPLLFKKSGEGFRICVDNRKLNEITIKDYYPIVFECEAKMNGS